MGSHDQEDKIAYNDGLPQAWSKASRSCAPGLKPAKQGPVSKGPKILAIDIRRSYYCCFTKDITPLDSGGY
jgi:hypothetical protein